MFARSISPEGGCARFGQLISGRFFIFLFFISVFTKIYFRFENLQKYTPAARPPAAGRQGLKRKKKKKKSCRQVPGAGRPVAGRPAPPGRPAAGRPALPPYIRVSWSTHPYFASLQFQKKEKRGREGGRRSPARFSSRRLQVTKILVRFTNSMIVCPDMASNYFC